MSVQRSAPTSGPKVVFINRYFHPDLSATSQMLSDLAFHLAARGVEVHVVCSRQLYDAPHATLHASERIEGVQVHRLSTTRFGRARLAGRACDYFTFYLSAALRLLRLARRGDVLVAKTDPPLFSLVAAPIARLRGAQLINWLQDIFPEAASRLGANPLPAWLDVPLRALRDGSLRAASANVLLGSRMRDYVLTRGIPPERLRVIENWSDAVTPMPASASRLRRSLGLTDRFVVAYSGNLGRAHEYDTLLSAAAALQREEGLVFLMIGGGALMEKLKTQTERRTLRNVLFLPYQSRETLSDSLAAGDVHLACLRPELEGLIVPSKFYGVLAAARPLIFIGDPDGELARQVRGHDCGRAVAAGDAEGLARLVRELRADVDLRACLGRRARELYEAHYTAERAAQSWIDLLRAIEPRLETIGHAQTGLAPRAAPSRPA